MRVAFAIHQKPAAAAGEKLASVLPALPSIPPPPMDAAARSRAQRALDESFGTTIQTADRYSLVVLDASGSTVYARHETVSVTPASTQKLIVASAALALLGGNYRFQTLVSASSPPSADGTMDGNLYLVGAGDPSLRSTDLQAGARAIAASGVRRVTGRLLVDPTALSGPEINPYWDPDDANEDYQTATSAISVDGDTAEFRVSGAGESGAPAVVSVLPKGAPVSLYGQIETSDENDVTIAAQEAPNTFRLSGSIPPGDQQKYWLPVHEMPQYAGDVFDRMLEDSNVALGGPPGVAPAPLDTIQVWSHRSQPLRALVHHMLYWSDNHYAEQLLRTLARERGDTPDDAGGIAVEKAFLRSRHLPPGAVQVVDGSGLAESNRIPAIVLARLLSDAELRGGLERLYDILPVGGKEGTLKYYGFSDAAGRVHAKSGHLTGVEGLAGYVDTRHHGRLAFAFLINHAAGDPDGEIVKALDRLAEL